MGFFYNLHVSPLGQSSRRHKKKKRRNATTLTWLSLPVENKHDCSRLGPLTWWPWARRGRWTPWASTSRAQSWWAARGRPSGKGFRVKG